MKHQHPGISAVRRLLKSKGFQYTQPYPSTFKFMGENMYPVKVDIEYSAHESKLRMIVDGLCDQSDIYPQIRAALHKVEIRF